MPTPVIDWSPPPSEEAAWAPAEPPRPSRTWWEQLLAEHEARFANEIGNVVERLRASGATTITLDDPAFREARQICGDMVDHFLAGKVLDGLLPAGEKRLHREQMNTQLDLLLLTLLTRARESS